MMNRERWGLAEQWRGENWKDQSVRQSTGPEQGGVLPGGQGVTHRRGDVKKKKDWL